MDSHQRLNRARAETPEEWVKLLTRVYGGFGSFLPVGIRIGEDVGRGHMSGHSSSAAHQGASSACAFHRHK
jgi:hypothetical protein